MFANLTKCGNDHCARFVNGKSSHVFDSRAFCSADCVHLYQIAGSLLKSYGRVDTSAMDSIRVQIEKLQEEQISELVWQQ